MVAPQCSAQQGCRSAELSALRSEQNSGQEGVWRMWPLSLHALKTTSWCWLGFAVFVLFFFRRPLLAAPAER